MGVLGLLRRSNVLSVGPGTVINMVWYIRATIQGVLCSPRLESSHCAHDIRPLSPSWYNILIQTKNIKNWTNLLRPAEASVDWVNRFKRFFSLNPNQVKHHNLVLALIRRSPLAGTATCRVCRLFCVDISNLSIQFQRIQFDLVLIIN